MASVTRGPWTVEKRTVLGRGPEADHYLIRHGASEVGIARKPADAHLIAAAPELLAALKDLASAGYRSRRSLAAIAKAEGRDQ